MYMTKGAETIRFICSSFLTFAMIIRKTGKGRNKQSGLVKLKQKKKYISYVMVSAHNSIEQKTKTYHIWLITLFMLRLNM